MRKIRFASIYLLTLAVVFLVLGAFTEWHTLHHNTLAAGTNGTPLDYPELLHLIFFFLGFLALSSIYFAERGEATALSATNTLLQKEMVERKMAEEKKERLICELQEALAEVKTLSGLLPVCSYCKKVRDDDGYWQQIESYIESHSAAKFSHGMCNDCLKKNHPEIYERLVKKGEIKGW